MLKDVKQETIKPIIESYVEKGTLIYIDEYVIYARLGEWGYGHEAVNHSKGEYARDEDGDGFVRSMSIQWKGFGRYCVHG